MKQTCYILLFLLLSFQEINLFARNYSEIEICIQENAGKLEDFAAREVRRYLYLRTGKFLQIKQLSLGETQILDNKIIIGSSQSKLIQQFATKWNVQNQINELKKEEYLLKTVSEKKGKTIIVCGSDEISTLYAAYKLMELFGIRYAPAGDIIPDGYIDLEMPVINKIFKPEFAIRGFLPYHSWNPEGPEYWNSDAYKGFVAQQVKMGMNFIGLIYDLENSDCKVYKFPPEPATWSQTETPVNFPPAGAHLAFKSEIYASERGLEARKMLDNSLRKEFMIEQNGKFIGDIFTFANIFGIKTCIGVEAIVTDSIENRYNSIFRDVNRLVKPDFYWISTPESWLWKPNDRSILDGIVNSYKAAIRVHESMKLPFRLATMGWTIDPKEAPGMMDSILPKSVAISSQNRNIGKDPVEPVWGTILNRDKWVIPWMEDDFNLLSPQLWVNRTIENATDALTYGCNGFIGVHWRTKFLSPQMMALASVSWNRSLNMRAFYQDFALTNFGEEAADEIANIFIKIDCKLPEATVWLDGWPGGIKQDSLFWENNEDKFGFIDEFAKIRPKIKGRSNLERFDYYFNQFEYLRALAKMRALIKTPKENEGLHEVVNYLMQSASTNGEIGNLLCISRQTGKNCDTVYTGEPHLIVLSPRTSLCKGENLQLDVFVIDKNSPQKVELFWRQLGSKKFNKMIAEHNRSNHFYLKLDASKFNEMDIEYYVKGTLGNGSELVFPANAPVQNMTVVTLDQ